MDDGGPIFQDPSSMISEHNGIGVPYQGTMKQDHIIRNDKLLTDGERISQPDSSDSDFCSTSTSDPRYNIINNRDSFTLNQNINKIKLSSYYNPLNHICGALLFIDSRNLTSGVVKFSLDTHLVGFKGNVLSCSSL